MDRIVETIKNEGVELESRPMGEGSTGAGPIVVEVDRDNPDKDIEALLHSPPVQDLNFYAKEVAAAVAAFEARLKSPWLEFFRLHFVEGLDYEEISTRLGIGRLRCKYMKRVLASQARRSNALMVALGRQTSGGRHAP